VSMPGSTERSQLRHESLLPVRHQPALARSMMDVGIRIHRGRTTLDWG